MCTFQQKYNTFLKSSPTCLINQDMEPIPFCSLVAMIKTLNFWFSCHNEMPFKANMSKKPTCIRHKSILTGEYNP